MALEATCRTSDNRFCIRFHPIVWIISLTVANSLHYTINGYASNLCHTGYKQGRKEKTDGVATYVNGPTT